MKRKILIFVASLISAYASSKDIKVSTLNCEFLVLQKVHVKYGFKFDLREESQEIQEQWTESYRKSKFDESVDKVANHIVSKISPDIIVLTEVGDSAQVKHLFDKCNENGAGFKAYLVSSSPSSGTGQHVALFSKYSISEYSSSIPGRAIYQSFESQGQNQDDDTGVSKGLVATIEVDGTEIEIYGLHLISQRDGYGNQQKRLAQVEVVRRHMLKSLKSNKPIIVLGDLNADKGQPSIKKLRGLDDIHEDLIQTVGPKYLKDGSLDWTYNYKAAFNQLDHGLVSFGLKELCKRGGVKSEVIETNDEAISDHHALTLNLRLK